MNTTDPLAASVDRALKSKWMLVPQIIGEASENALVLFGKEFTYVVTIPVMGDSSVVCFQGGPPPGHPRRPAREAWRNRVPVETAVNWALSNSRDDRELRDYGRPAQGRS